MGEPEGSCRGNLRAAAQHVHATQPKENKSLPVQMSQCARAPVQCDPHHFFRLHVSALADERLDHLKVPIKAGGVERRRFVLPTCKTDEGGTTGVNARAVT